MHCRLSYSNVLYCFQQSHQGHHDVGVVLDVGEFRDQRSVRWAAAQHTQVHGMQRSERDLRSILGSKVSIEKNKEFWNHLMRAHFQFTPTVNQLPLQAGELLGYVCQGGGHGWNRPADLFPVQNSQEMHEKPYH